MDVFERREGALIRGVRLPADGEAHAIDKACEVAELFGGAVALQLVVDRYGKVWSTNVLATVGEVPAVEQLAELWMSGASGKPPR